MSRTKTKQQPTICKIVCFDEGSATDYIQIVNGGDTTTTKERTSEKDASASGEVGVNKMAETSRHETEKSKSVASCYFHAA